MDLGHQGNGAKVFSKMGSVNFGDENDICSGPVGRMKVSSGEIGGHSGEVAGKINDGRKGESFDDVAT